LLIYNMGISNKEIIKELQERIEKLFSLYNVMMKDNDLLYKENIKLKTEIESQESEKNYLIDVNNKLKLSKSVLVSSKDKHEAKIKINKMVREIDKCISLLNT
ncbi:MAG: hypothetical protein PF487_03035, partial [Bacteroidales bacterium]|nr:hypothetical protein [Bacteroidales bacterium]